VAMFRYSWRFSNLQLLILSTLILIIAGEVQALEPNSFPEFSWDTVPVYMHIRKRSAFTNDEIDYIARFPLVTFEKTHAYQSYPSTEQSIPAEAQRVKTVNPLAKILFYWNVFMDYEGYEAHDVFQRHPEWWLRDKDGALFLVRDEYKTYDFTIPEMRDWWIAVSTQAVSNASIHWHGQVDINFKEYANFASFWMSELCSMPDFCQGYDYDKNGVVDTFDLGVITNRWLMDLP
jgi:hypothetical protein